MQTRMKPELMAAAQVLLDRFPNDPLLKKTVAGEKITASEYDNVLLHPQKEILDFYNNRASRPELVSQLKLDNRLCTVAGIVVCTDKKTKKKYVVLVNNTTQALSQAKDAGGKQEIISLSTRVDESYLAQYADPNNTSKLKDAQDVYKVFYGALQSRLKELGFNDTELSKREEASRYFDRDLYGTPEKDPNYRTEHLYIPIEVDNIEDLKQRIHGKEKDLPFASMVRIADFDEMVERCKKEKYPAVSLSSSSAPMTIRESTRNFLLAINNIVSENLTLPQQGKAPIPQREEVKMQRLLPPWLKPISGAAQSEYIQHSLYQHNKRPLPATIELARATVGQGWLSDQIENVAIKSMKPERLLFHEALAQLIVNVKMDMEKPEEVSKRVDALVSACNTDEFKAKVKEIDDNAATLTITPELVEQAWKSLGSTREKAQEAFKAYRAATGSSSPGSFSKPYDTFDAVEKEIVRDYFYTQAMAKFCHGLISNVLNGKIANHEFEAVPVSNNHMISIVCGPVASGKSSSLQALKELYPNSQPILISSDSLMEVVLAGQKLEGYETIKGLLNLTESYFIKQLVYTILKDKFSQHLPMPDVQLETMNPYDRQLLSMARPDTTVAVYMNTASPLKSLERVEARGEKEKRYVGPAATISSYKDTFSRLIAFIGSMEASTARNVKLVLRDTDALNAPRGVNPELKASYLDKENANILEIDFAKNEININSLPRLVSCISRLIELPTAPELTRQKLETITGSSTSNPMRMFAHHGQYKDDNAKNAVREKIKTEIDKLFNNKLIIKIGSEKGGFEVISKTELQKRAMIIFETAFKLQDAKRNPSPSSGI